MLYSDHPLEIVGFVLDRVAGLRPTYLNWHPGLTVLYGLNGAGKTRVLDAIRDAFDGVEGGAGLLVRVPSQGQDQTSSGEDFEASSLQGQLCAAWDAAALLPSDLHPQEKVVPQRVFERVYREAVKNLVAAEVAGGVDPLLGPLDPGRVLQLREELLSQRLILVRSVGTLQHPSWEVAPAAVESDDYPALTAELRRTVATDRWEEDHSRIPEGVDDPADLRVFELIRTAETVVGLAVGRWGDFRTIDQLELGMYLPDIGDDPTAATMASLSRKRELDATLSKMSGQLRLYEAAREFMDETGVTDEIAELLDSEARGLEASMAREHDFFNPETGGASQWVIDHARHIGGLAQIYFRKVLLDAPALELTVRQPGGWWGKPPVSWTFGPQRLPIHVMSTAQTRWANWAISLAAGLAYQPCPSLSLLDEPEQALHRSAEAHMAQRIAGLTGDAMGLTFLVSTHSPELLNQPGARVIEVSRVAGGDSRLRPLEPADKERLQGLGLLPSDLLRRQRAFLLVEGAHDEALLDVWIGDQLRELRVEVVPLHGARTLAEAPNSMRVLFDFTDAHLVVLLDNISARKVGGYWHSALRLKEAEGAGPAASYLRRQLGNKPQEAEWLGQWLSRAIKQDKDSRVIPYGLSEPDIIQYIPVDRLVSGASSWTEVVKEWRWNAHKGEDGRQRFKEWLWKSKGAKTHVEHLMAVALDTPVPTEMTGLVTELSEKLGAS